jgi:hypothetical protein
MLKIHNQASKIMQHVGNQHTKFQINWPMYEHFTIERMKHVTFAYMSKEAITFKIPKMIKS